MGLTPSERLVAEFCQRSFLSLWTHRNPIGKNGKELCDCLVVCGAHIVIVSVKAIDYQNTGNDDGWKRWQKTAIDKSARQIWGAERWLRAADRVLRNDGRQIQLPPKNERMFHRILVSLGGRGAVPLRWGDLGHGFVHLLDEYSLAETFRELDTIGDFVTYLAACESLFDKGVQLLFSGGGAEDLLAMYVQHGPGFGILGADSVPDMALITDGIWTALLNSPDYQTRNADLESSYAWDRLIEHYADDLLADGMFDMHSKEVTRNELALVAMALQPRGHRANLADAFLEFLSPGSSRVSARVVVAANSTAFVFLSGDSNDREHRARELALRCLVVRGRCNGVTTVVGIATDRPTQGKPGHSSDIAYLHMPIWSAEDGSRVEGIQAELGYFKDTKWRS